MPTPSTAVVTQRPDLASFEEYNLENERNGYVGQVVLPVIEAGLQSDNPGKIPLESLLFSGDTTRTSGAAYNRGSYKFDKFTYATQENGWEEPIDERDEKRYRHIIVADTVARNRCYGIVTRNQEKRAAAMVFDPNVWSDAALTTEVINEWDDAVNAVPVTDVEAAVRKVYSGTGLFPNAMVINRLVFRNLRNSGQIIDRIESAGAGSPSKPSDVTIEMLKAVFDLEYIIVGGASKNDANEAATAVPEQIWSGEYAMVCRIATGPDMREACIGRTFHWAEDGSVIGGAIEEYEEVQSRSRIIRVRHETDEVIMYPACGHLLSNITT